MSKLRIGIIVPHIFINQEILNNVIFAPGFLAINLAEGLSKLGHSVTLFTPGSVNTTVNNITANLEMFQEECKQDNMTILELIKHKPLTYVSLVRQVQAQLIAKAFMMANKGDFDLIHNYTNEEELAMVFSDLCNVPIVFTHHDPFNMTLKYRNIMPQYKDLNWVSLSYAQRRTMPSDTNFIANIYNGLPINQFQLNENPSSDYFAYFGRIIEDKGVHLAIEACKKAGVKLKIAGKHYASPSKNSYWTQQIEPRIDGENVEYIGFISNPKKKEEFLGNAKGLIVPSIFEEPFGMVTIESLACGTPVIGSNRGAIPEIIKDNKTGFIINLDEKDRIEKFVNAIKNIDKIERADCRKDFEERFISEKMCKNYSDVYIKLLNNN